MWPHLLAIWHALFAIVKIVSEVFGVIMALLLFANTARDKETGRLRAWGYSFFGAMASLAVCIGAGLLHLWAIMMPVGCLLVVLLLLSLVLIFAPPQQKVTPVTEVSAPVQDDVWPPAPKMPQTLPATVRLFPYGVSRSRLERAAKTLGVQAVIVNNVTEADAIIALKANYRKEPVKLHEGISRGIPICWVESNAYEQIDKAMRDILPN